jgi:hypothetical protein
MPNIRDVVTHIWTFFTPITPFGSAVKNKLETAMTARRPIINEESIAEPLEMRCHIVCILVSCVLDDKERGCGRRGETEK